MSDHSLLPPLADLIESVRTSSNASDPPLAHALSLLFETSPTLSNILVPEFSRRLGSASNREQPKTYAQLIDQALTIVHGWTWNDQAAFVGAHPRIGEVNGLSALSSAEQGQAAQTSVANAIAPTPPEVLARLAFLNAAYERRYPGLVYITFVNGRSRAQIKDELESKLSEEGVLPIADKDEGLEKIAPHDVPGEVWCKEVERAVDDVGKIAKGRLGKLGYE
ncbi:Oxo-4-hydroxy-4-carboxy-5-ureidoimidazoline decarboxylase [Phellopilus nigrolimitatus]|nr:Oxo-4-hydroxy-4-carboxy-5-ureidoimidazoline decarboxylase [Phellopilus nigrolimitatus]